MQFCGPGSFGLSFWEGLTGLAVTVPLNLWVMRLFRDRPPEEAFALARANKAHERLAEGHVLGKMVLRIHDS